jgi:hypothetical protein
MRARPRPINSPAGSAAPSERPTAVSGKLVAEPSA